MSNLESIGFLTPKALSFYRNKSFAGDDHLADPLYGSRIRSKGEIEEMRPSDRYWATYSCARHDIKALVNPECAIPIKGFGKARAESDGENKAHDDTNEYPFDYFDTVLYLLYRTFFSKPGKDGKGASFSTGFLKDFLERNQLFVEEGILQRPDWQDRLIEYLKVNFLQDDFNSNPLSISRYQRKNQFYRVNKAIKRIKEIILQFEICTESILAQEYENFFDGMETGSEYFEKGKELGYLDRYPELRLYQSPSEAQFEIRIFFLYYLLDPSHQYNSPEAMKKVLKTHPFLEVADNTATYLYNVFYGSLISRFPFIGSGGFKAIERLLKARSFKRKLFEQKQNSLLQEPTESLIEDINSLLKKNEIDKGFLIRLLKSSKKIEDFKSP